MVLDVFLIKWLGPILPFYGPFTFIGGAFLQFSDTLWYVVPSDENSADSRCLKKRAFSRRLLEYSDQSFQKIVEILKI